MGDLRIHLRLLDLNSTHLDFRVRNLKKCCGVKRHSPAYLFFVVLILDETGCDTEHGRNDPKMSSETPASKEDPVPTRGRGRNQGDFEYASVGGLLSLNDTTPFVSKQGPNSSHIYFGFGGGTRTFPAGAPLAIGDLGTLAPDRRLLVGLLGGTPGVIPNVTPPGTTAPEGDPAEFGAVGGMSKGTGGGVAVPRPGVRAPETYFAINTPFPLPLDEGPASPLT